jgi:DNA-binding GntR family transcriptional regulator
MGVAVEKAYRAIRAGIADGTYPSNAHITAGELALKLGVSRTPVREALRRLHAEGLVNFVANHGAYVTSWTRTDIDEVFELRSTLESYAAERAARRLSPEQLAELNQLARRMEQLSTRKPEGYLDRIAEANSRFHRVIVEAAANRRLAAMVAGVVEMPLVVRTFSVYTETDLQRSMAHHRELLDAFAARDGRWAASVMCSHIQAAHSAYTAATTPGRVGTAAA